MKLGPIGGGVVIDEETKRKAMASGRAGDRQKKIEELLEVFSRYTR